MDEEDLSNSIIWNNPDLSREDKVKHLNDELQKCYLYLSKERNLTNKKMTQLVINKKVLYEWIMKDLIEKQ